MAEKKCNFCGKLCVGNEQVAALDEDAIKQVQSKNPGLVAGPSVGTDPAGKRRWVMCLQCCKKYGLV